MGRLGIGICYDIRFPEMAQLYAARGVQLIVYPGELLNHILLGRCRSRHTVILGSGCSVFVHFLCRLVWMRLFRLVGPTRLFPASPCKAGSHISRTTCRRVQHDHRPRALGAAAEGAGGGQPAVCGHLLTGAQVRLMCISDPGLCLLQQADR